MDSEVSETMEFLSLFSLHFKSVQDSQEQQEQEQQQQQQLSLSKERSHSRSKISYRNSQLYINDGLHELQKNTSTLLHTCVMIDYLNIFVVLQFTLK